MSGIVELGKNVVEGIFSLTGTLLSPPKTPSVPATAVPKKASKTEEKKKILKKRRKVASPTILTSALGLTGEALTKKPTLLGG